MMVATMAPADNLAKSDMFSSYDGLISLQDKCIQLRASLQRRGARSSDRIYSSARLQRGNDQFARSQSAALTICLAELAIDADRFLVQHLRCLGLASEQPGGRERAEAASEGLSGATGTHQGVGLTQEALAFFDVIRPQPRRPSPQQGTSLMKPVTEFAVQNCSAHGLVVIGGVFKFSDLACLPGEKPSSHCCRRLLVELGERLINPAPVLQLQAELGPQHVTVPH